MKKLITILLLVITCFIGYSQIEQYPYSAGQYYIFDIGNTTIESAKQATGGKISFMNHVEVVDTIFKVPAANANDTISTILSAANALSSAIRPAILFEEGTVLRSQITVGRNNMYFGSYDSTGGLGTKPIINGADYLTGIAQVYNWTSAWSATLSSANSNGTYYNFRQVVTPSVSGSTIRIKFKNGVNTAATIAGASIGVRSGTTDDFASTPTRITFGGGIDTVNMEVSGIAESDEISFSVTSGTSYLVHVYMKVAYGYSFVLSGTAYRSTSTSDNTLTETIDYGASAAATRIVSDIEVIGSAVENMYKKSGITTQPRAMWYNDTIATLTADTASLDVDGEWYWNSGTSTFFVYATSDPNGNVELGQRGNLITITSKDNITLKNLAVKHSNATATQSGAIYVNGSNYLTVNGCNISDNYNHGIKTDDVKYLIVDNNVFTRNGIVNNTGSNFRADWSTAAGHVNVKFRNNISTYSGANGCLITTTPYTNYYRVSNIEISGNTFDYNKAAGAYTQRCDTVSVYNNSFNGNGDGSITGEDYAFASEGCGDIDFYNNTIKNQQNNDAVQFWSSSSEAGHNIRIFNNNIDSVLNGDGISLVAYNDNTMNNPLVAYNVVSNASNNGLIFENGGATSTYSANVFNNTVYKSGWFSLEANASFPIVAKNNIFSEGASTLLRHTGTLLTSSNNLYYRASGTLLSVNAVTYTAATITGYEATAQTGNPLFTNSATGDFSLQVGSPAINNGTDVGLTTDILGNPIVGTPDIGAYESSFIPSSSVFYVDAINGNDTNDGNTQPWKTLAKVNASTFSAGDSILLKSGDTWREQLTVPSSGAVDNYIVFDSYGSGELPIIEGADIVTGFTRYTDSLWQKTNVTVQPNLLFLNDTMGILQANAAACDTNGQWYYNAATDVLYVYDNAATSTPGLGSDVMSGWDFTSGWTTSSATIVDNNTFTTTATGGGIWSVPTTLVQAGKSYKIRLAGTTNATTGVRLINLTLSTEIYIPYQTGTFDITDTVAVTVTGGLRFRVYGTGTFTTDITAFTVEEVGVMLATNMGTVEIGQRKGLIDIGSNSHITLKNLTVLHSNEESSPTGHDWYTAGIYADTTSHITIDNCTVKHSGFIGVFFRNVDNIDIRNSNISYSGQSWMDGENIRIEIKNPNFRNYSFTNNYIGYSGENGILLTTDLKSNAVSNVEVAYNTFEHCFDTGVYLQRGDSSSIHHNTFDSCGDLADSGEDYSIGIGDYDWLDIYNNTITNQLNNDAIQIYSDNRDATVSGSSHYVRIFNNSIDTVYNGNGIGINAMDSLSAKDLKIYYNVIANIIDTIGIVDKFGISLNNVVWFGTTAIADTVDIYNNTIYALGTRAINTTDNFPYILKNNILSYNLNFAINEIASTTGLISSNNLWHTLDGSNRVLQYNGVTYAYTAGSYTAIATFEPTAKTGNPLFTNAATGDFTLQTGSPAINNGVDVGLTTDRNGNPIVGNPDIGSEETITP